MKKLATATILLAFGFLLGLVLLASRLPVRAGGTGSATKNGDTNGDGELDIGDAVYLLLHFFKGGPPPAVCADTPALLARVTLLEEKLTALEGLPAMAAGTAADLATFKDIATRFIPAGHGNRGYAPGTSRSRATHRSVASCACQIGAAGGLRRTWCT